ncbi:MAG: membrane protein [Methylibium sp. NZG]|nr:MAG: membrane protein [Methylibium sp. NZG]
MNDVIDIEDDRQRSLKTVGHISYLLHTIVALSAVVPGVQASIALLIVAFIIDMVKKDDAAGTWQESHFRWRIRSVLWAGALYVVTIPLWILLVLPGWIAWVAISIWFLYRVIRGWVNLNAGKAMPQ